MARGNHRKLRHRRRSFIYRPVRKAATFVWFLIVTGALAAGVIATILTNLTAIYVLTYWP